MWGFTKNNNNTNKAAKKNLGVILNLVMLQVLSFFQAHAESKLENLEDQLRRARTQVDEFTRLNGDLNNWKARLSQENLDLQRQVQELDSSNGGLSKTKSVLLAQLDEAKSKLDEETRVRSSY